jgi:phospholipid-binding lipoprotein MlaA
MRRRFAMTLPLAALLLAVASAAPAARAQDAGDEEDVSVRDPWEGVNRSIFDFNEGLDRWFLEPVAKGWDFVMPDPVERAIGRFFENLGMPVVFLNDVLQGKPVAAGQDVARFAINTTSGMLGFFDPATDIGLPANDEDFGQTLGVWGVPAGPYLMLPLLGPSSPRDTGGLVADTLTRAGYTWYIPIPMYASTGMYGVSVVNRRSRLLETIAEERKSALDFYAAVRNAHVKSRENRVRDRKPKEGEGDEDLYYLDIDDE